jgi:zinc protease
MDLATKDYTLDNGLKLLVREMHHAPVSAFFVCYRVGARNEVPGITGISHWVEHMMFKGTPRYGKGQLDRMVSKRGGMWNGFTTENFTAYFEVLPVQHLDLSLDIESDRMANCIFDPSEVQSERTVIISEREGAENSPEFWLDEAVTRVAFLVHPYGQGVIGAKSDLERITRDDLYKHYRTFYAPNNAIAVAAGDFRCDEVYEKTRKYFGAIPRGPEVPQVRSVEPPQEGERRLVIRRPGGARQCMMAFHMPFARDPGIYAVLVLDAVLSGGKPMAGWGGRGGMGRSSRLYRALVESGIASTVTSYAGPSIDPYLLQVEMTVQGGVETDRAEKAVSDVFAALREDEVSPAEMEKAKKQVRAQVAYSMESAQNNAMALGMWEVLSTWKDADQVSQRINAVTPADVLEAARKTLAGNNRTVGWFIPEGPAGGGAGPQGPARKTFFYSGTASGRVTGNAGMRRAGGGHAEASAPVKMPGPAEIRRKVLPNGLVLLAHRNPSVEFTVAQALLDAGSFASSPEREGIARFCATCLLRGTARHTSQEINEFTDRYGMSLTSGVSTDAATISVTSLTEDAQRALDLLAEVLTEPAFRDEEVERLKGQTIVAIKQAEKDTQAAAEKAFNEMVYPGDHPYSLDPLGTEDSVRSLSGQDLVSFHRTFYSPDHAIVAVVSKCDPEEVFSSLEKSFGGWKANPDAGRAGPAREMRAKHVGRPDGKRQAFLFIPGKTQCDIALGLPSVRRSDPDYMKLTVMNMVLGQMGLGGRIGHNVRDKQGLAYYVGSYVREAKGQGAWAVRAGVSPKGVEKAIGSILEEIRSIQSTPVTDEELADVKGFMTGYLPLSIETSRGLAANMLHMEYYGLGLDYLQRFPAAVEAVTKGDVQEMARKHLSADDYVVVVTGPEVKKG